MIKSVFFDLDNVLYPTSIQTDECRKNAVRAMIKSMFDLGIKKIPLLRDMHLNLKKIIEEQGSNADNHFDLLLKRYKITGTQGVAVREAGRNAYHKSKFDHVSVFEDAEITLKFLEKKYRLGIITNGIAEKQLSKINLLGLYKYFKTGNIIITSAKSKNIFILAAKKANVLPKKCVYVGDKPEEDVLGAFNSGFVPVLFKNGPYFDKDKCLKKLKEGKHYHTIRNLSELIKLIPRL